jgi:hypothetical protein
MYALHPGSLPPVSAKAKERVEVTAEDLIALYHIDPTECIVWDKTDGYDWFDFIHLYPSYYERYTLKPDGTPEKDIPDVTHASASPANPVQVSRDTRKSSRARHT